MDLTTDYPAADADRPGADAAGAIWALMALLAVLVQKRMTAD